jgi:N4-gp56 family major capsid protein
MAVNTTSNITQIAKYKDTYVKGAMRRRIYDQFASPVGKDLADLIKGSSVNQYYLNNLDPATSAISETVDVVPEKVTDATASMSPTSRGKALLFSELLDIQGFADYPTAAYRKVGDNAMEGIELLAMAAGLQGGMFSRATTRDLLNAGTATDYCNDTAFDRAQVMLETLQCPEIDEDSGGGWLAAMHPFAFSDLRRSGNILNIAAYQHPEILLRHELGRVGAFRVLVSAWCKVFGGAGADNATAVATTLNGAVLKGAKTIVTAGDVSANIGTGNFWTIGTEETGATHYPDNEIVKVTGASTVTLTIVGSGDNGGTRFDHPTGAAVRNADNVYPVLYGSPSSMSKIYADQVGEYGEVSPIENYGTMDQFRKIFWKWYGGYSVLNQNWLVRGEYASSLDNI